MTKKPKYYRVASEGELEDMIKVFYKVAKSVVKKKVLHIQVPTLGMSNILLLNVAHEFTKNKLGDPSAFHVNILIEEGTNQNE